MSCITVLFKNSCIPKDIHGDACCFINLYKACISKKEKKKLKLSLPIHIVENKIIYNLGSYVFLFQANTIVVFLKKIFCRQIIQNFNCIFFHNACIFCSVYLLAGILDCQLLEKSEKFENLLHCGILDWQYMLYRMVGTETK